MTTGAATRTVEFSPSRQRATVDLGRLRDATVEFLELWAEPPLVGLEFLALVGDGSGESRFERLLEATGCGGDPSRFFDRVLEQLAVASVDAPAQVTVGSLRLPNALVLELLEVVLPGDELIDVKRLARHPLPRLPR